MKNIHNYDIIECNDLSDLRKEVLEAMGADWQPIGGICVVPASKEVIEGGGNEYVYFQSMVQYG